MLQEQSVMLAGLVIGKTYFIQLDGFFWRKRRSFFYYYKHYYDRHYRGKNNLNVFNENGEIKSEIFKQ